MDRDEARAAIAAERRELADFLDTLDAEDWAVDSLCAGWTVHDVVAHLTLSTRQSLLGTLVRVARARGDFDRVTAEMGRERARAYGPAELVAQVREMAGSSRRFALSGPLDPLVDLLVHGQDIARPLGRQKAMDLDRVVPALDYVWGSRFYGTQKRFAGVRLQATDVDWSAGDGEREVRGPAGDLLLLATGRAAALPAVTGEGVGEVAARMG